VLKPGEMLFRERRGGYEEGERGLVRTVVTTVVRRRVLRVIIVIIVVCVISFWSDKMRYGEILPVVERTSESWWLVRSLI